MSENLSNEVTSKNQTYSVPDPFLDTLWELTGTGDNNSGGYMLAYVNGDGSPVIRFRSGNQTIEMGLRKVMATFLEHMDNNEVVPDEEFD